MSDNIFNSIFPDDTDPDEQELTEAARAAEEAAADAAAEAADAAAQAVDQTVESVADTAGAVQDSIFNAVSGATPDTPPPDTDFDTLVDTRDVPAPPMEDVSDMDEESAEEAANTVAEQVEGTVDQLDSALSEMAPDTHTVADSMAAADTVADTVADTDTAADTEVFEDHRRSPLDLLFGSSAPLDDDRVSDWEPDPDTATAETVETGLDTDTSAVDTAVDDTVDTTAATALEGTLDTADWVAGEVVEVAETSAEAADEHADTSEERAHPVEERAHPVEERAPSVWDRLYGTTASTADAIIPDDAPADSPESAESAEPVSSAEHADLAPAAVQSRAPEGVLAAQPVPAVEPVKDAAQWDDELSPELAALLFADERTAAASSASADTVADTAATAVTREVNEAASKAAETTPPGKDKAFTGSILPAAPILAALAPATPVELTRIADARTLHLYAGGHSAPAPDIPLTGKVRYTRVEEPLRNDQGERVRELWQYYKPDYPGLAGRLVREVRSDEIRFSDGSWRWTFERTYVDRGRDRRIVRAGKDGNYIERYDEVSIIDAGTDRRTSYKAEAKLIFAPPEEEKRGGFFSALLGKDDDAAVLSPVWREASGKEARAARRSGGRAF